MRTAQLFIIASIFFWWGQGMATTPATANFALGGEPEFTVLPESLTEDCDTADYQAWLSTQRTRVQAKADSCGLQSISDNAPPDPMGTCFTVVVTFLALDSCGQAATAEATYEKRDSIPPAFIPFEDTLIVNCDAVPLPDTPEVSDNCALSPSVLFTEFFDVDSCPQAYKLTRTWIAFDDCLNTDTFIQIVIVQDTSPPAWVGLPADTTVSCDGIPPPPFIGVDILAVDACAGNQSISFSDSSTQLTDTSVCGYYQYSIIRQWTASDPCGNVTIASQHITVIDSSAPVLMPPPDLTISCENAGDLNATGVATATDNCDSSPQVQFNSLLQAGSCPAEFQLKRSWWATDVCGNVSDTFVQTIFVIDEKKPNLLQPAADLSLSCVDTLAADSLFQDWVQRQAGALASDNCGIISWFAAVPSSYELNDPLSYPGMTPGSLDTFECPDTLSGFFARETVDFVAVDECGNAIRTTATFAVLDNAPPIIIRCPKDTAISVSDTSCEATFLLSAPRFEEACSEVALFYQLDNNDTLSFQPEDSIILTLDKRIHTIRFFLHDCAGNTNTCQQRVQVVDSIAPSLICPQDTILFIQPGQACQGGTAYLLPAALAESDNCGLALSSFSVSGATLLSERLRVTNDTVVVFPGLNTFLYASTDSSGLRSECSFNLDLSDSIPPIAVCQDINISVSPSGEQPGLLNAVSLNAGSSDNCGELSFSASIDTIPCTWADSTIETTLVVADVYGNTDTCTSQVSVSLELPAPSSFSSTCGDDTLFLFANPPDTFSYTYQWVGPAAFSSALPNPFRAPANPAFSGQYSLTITGSSGCMASASTEVSINGLPPTPSLQAVRTAICVGDSILLQSQEYTGGTTIYFWYEKTISGDTLVAQTNTAEIALDATQAGSRIFTVVVSFNGCLSNFSLPVNVQITEPPIATTTNDPLIILCEGEAFVLGTDVSGPEISYSWTGPGFVSSLQNPPPFLNANPVQSGEYRLQLSRNNCLSNVVVTEVVVRPLPPLPGLSSNAPICSGEELILFTNVADGSVYTWTDPALNEFTTDVPALSIPAASLSSNGNWTVQVDRDGCISPLSQPLFVTVEEAPMITAANDGPICRGEQVQLSATDIAGVNYQWSGPAGFFSNLAAPRVLARQGLYSVSASSPIGCTSSDSTFVITVQAARITAAALQGDPCVNGADDIRLVAQVFPADSLGSYKYNWQGVNTFQSSDSVAIIPNATADDSGPYTLQLQDDNGCFSNTVVVNVSLVNRPDAPALSPQGSIELCAGQPLTLTASTVSGLVDYIWQTPTGNIIRSIPSLTYDSLQPLNSGSYSLYAVRDGCASDSSNQLSVLVNALPQVPLIDVVDSVVCPGENILLSTPLLTDAVYEWIGPAGFNPTAHNPAIVDAEEIHEGNYFVRLSINGCASAFSAPVYVRVAEEPTKPFLLNNGPFCIADSLDVLLEIAAGTLTPGASYQWIDAATDTAVSPLLTATTFILNEPERFGAGDHPFYVVASNEEGCSSQPSNTTTVRLDSRPAIIAFAGVDEMLCDENAIRLNAEAPSIGLGQWEQIGGLPATLTNPNAPNTQFVGLENNQTYLLQWKLTNGACTDYSADTISIRTFAKLAFADAGADLFVCDTLASTLSAVPPFFGEQGQWVQPVAQSQAGIIIADPDDPNSAVVNLVAGNAFTFIWQVQNEGCGIYDSDTTILTVGERPDAASAGIDITLCEDVAILDAQTPQRGNGRWERLSGEADIEMPDNSLTRAIGLSAGINLFEWQVNSPGCTTTNRDTVQLTYFPAPIPVDDILETAFATAASIDLFENDILFDDPEVSIRFLDSPEAGSLIPQNRPGLYRYIPSGTFFGSFEVIYELCSSRCPSVCHTATLIISVSEGQQCKVPTIVTPNDDGINDGFIIPCLSAGNFPNNRLLIFNQWGDELFKAAPYSNDWLCTYDGITLPAGTYFYQFDLGDGTPTQAGFFVVER